MSETFFSILLNAEELTTKCFTCGGQEFPYQLSVFCHNAINVVKIIVPIILVIIGVIDMVKATASQKEDEMKKAQMTFVKRLISGLLVFFVIVIVQFLFNILSNVGFGGGFTDCLDTFINGHAFKHDCGTGGSFEGTASYCKFSNFGNQGVEILDDLVVTVTFNKNTDSLEYYLTYNGIKSGSKGIGEYQEIFIKDQNKNVKIRVINKFGNESLNLPIVHGGMRCSEQAKITNDGNDVYTIATFIKYDK